MTKEAIAQAFSLGKFEKNFPHLAPNVEWIIFGEGANNIQGKEAVMSYCKQIAQYFDSLETVFEIENIVNQNNKIAINGTAELKREGKTFNFTRSCDFYEFDDHQNLKKITSYCIAEK